MSTTSNNTTETLHFKPIFNIAGYKMRYVEMHIDDNGHVIVTYTDGSTSDIGSASDNPVNLLCEIDSDDCSVENGILVIGNEETNEPDNENESENEGNQN